MKKCKTSELILKTRKRWNLKDAEKAIYTENEIIESKNCSQIEII